MYKAKNNSTQTEGIAGVPVFRPGEEREVSENVYNRLCRNPHFECRHTESKANQKTTYVEEENDLMKKKKK